MERIRKLWKGKGNYGKDKEMIIEVNIRLAGYKRSR